MDNLDTYFKSEGAMSLTALANAIGVSKGRLSQLRYSTEWPAQIALDVERATGRKGLASKLCPVIAQARGIAA